MVLAMIITGLAGGDVGDVVDLKGAGAVTSGAGAGGATGSRVGGVTGGAGGVIGADAGAMMGVVGAGGVVGAAGAGVCGAAQPIPLMTRLNSAKTLNKRKIIFFTDSPI